MISDPIKPGSQAAEAETQSDASERPNWLAADPMDYRPFTEGRQTALFACGADSFGTEPMFEH